MHPANEVPQGAEGTEKRSCTSRKKERQKFFQKSFADQKKVVYLQPLKTATLAAEKFMEIMFWGVDWGSKRTFKKKLSKTLWEPKKGFIFAPA